MIPFQIEPCRWRWNHGALLCLLVCLAVTRTAPAAATRQYQVLYVGPAAHAALDGVRQGLDEANLQGSFLGYDFRLDTAPAVPPDDAPGTRYMAVIAATGPDGIRALARRFEGVPVFNVSSDADGLRATCTANLLHVVPSAAMKQDAVTQWHAGHPDAAVTAAAWHADFVKYAARDLNKRFAATHDRPMDDPAWAGWAALRMTAEVLARSPDATPAQVLEALRHELRFDGQKGVEMTFRDNGQLRQPLLLIADGGIAGEAPVRGIADTDDLDSLGNTGCNP